MPETFDTATTNPGAGGVNLCGDSFTQSATSKFLPACYLVFGPSGDNSTRVDSGAGLPVDIQDATIAVTDNGSSLTVDAPVGTPVFVRLSDGSSAISTLPVSISATVTVDTELPAATSLIDGLANPSAPAVGCYLMLYDVSDSTWKRGRGNSSDGLLVNLGSNNDVTLTSGTLTSITNTVTVTGTGGTFPVTDSGGSLTVDDGGSTLSIDDGGGAITVDGAVTVSGSVSVSGEVDVLPATPAATEYLPVRLSDGSAFLSALPVTDNSGSLSVDDNGGSLSIDDGGGTITVDGTVSATQSGTWTVTGAGGTFPVTGTFWQATQPVSIAATVTVDTELPVAAALADGASNPTAPAVDGRSSTFNGSTWDRMRGNVEGTLLASAARTATTSSADVTNHNGRGVMIFLDITANTGAISLNPFIQGKDPISGNYVALHASPTTITATGTRVFTVYPGATDDPFSGQSFANTVPRTWRLTMQHNNANSVTYSVGYILLP